MVGQQSWSAKNLGKLVKARSLELNDAVSGHALGETDIPSSFTSLKKYGESTIALKIAKQ